MKTSSSLAQPPYALESITDCEPPNGASGSDWYCYKIVQGSNTIVGYKCGDLKTVTEAIENNVEFLNERQKGRYSHSKSTGAKKSSTS